MQEVTLRKATPADVEKYIELDRKVQSRTYSAITDPGEVLAEMVKGPVYMAEREGVVVGMISYETREDKSIQLNGFVVDPEYQGRGFGRAIMEKILAEIKDAPLVELLTHPDNAPAVSLYQSLGFKITGRQENHFGDGEPRIILTLKQKP